MMIATVSLTVVLLSAVVARLSYLDALPGQHGRTPEGFERGWIPLLAWVGVVLVVRRATQPGARPWMHVAALALLGFVTTLGFASMNPRGLFDHFSRTYAPHFTGYYGDADDFNGPGDLLCSFTERQATLSPHGRVRPPGPIAFYMATNAIARRTAAFLASQGAVEDEALLQFKLEGVLPALLLPLLAQLWLFPLFFLSRSLHGVRTAWMAVALGTLLPSMVLMTPFIMQLAPFLVLVPLAMLHAGHRSRRPFLSAAAGALFTLTWMVGFGHLVLLLPYALFLLLGVTDRTGLRQTAVHFMLFLVAWLLGAAVLRWGFGFRILLAFEHAAAHHRDGVTHLRAYAPFLLLSPAQFLLWIGAPIVVALGVRLGHAAVRFPRELRADRLLWAGVAAVVFLDVLGMSRGETHRLWLFLVPFLVLPAARCWADRLRGDFRGWVLVLGCLWLQVLVFQQWMGID